MIYVGNIGLKRVKYTFSLYLFTVNKILFNEKIYFLIHFGIREFFLYPVFFTYVLYNSICGRWVFPEYNRISFVFSLAFSFFLPFRATNRWHAHRARISAGSVLPLFVLTYISEAPPRKPSHECPIPFFPAVKRLWFTTRFIASSFYTGNAPEMRMHNSFSLYFLLSAKEACKGLIKLTS